MKLRIKKLTPKIIVLSIAVLFIASFVPNILWEIFGDDQIFEGGRNLTEEDIEHFGLIMLLVGFTTVSVAMTLYSLVIRKLVIQRVKKLNMVTEEVMTGNFDVSVDDKKYDEISQLSKNFDKMVEGLRSNEYMNKEFVRNFSHELKTPLSAIKGYADLLALQDLSQEELQEYATIISEEADRLSELSKNMLLISLVDSQVIIQKSKEFNVAEQIRNVVQLTQLEWESKQINLQLHMEDFLITTNKELLYQVWMNLFSNAVKFSDIGDSIDIELVEEENNLSCTFTNSNEIPKEDQAKIFNLFFVSEKSRSKQSSGVGLTLTKKIVEKMDGTIRFTSENNETKFTVTIPKK